MPIYDKNNTLIEIDTNQVKVELGERFEEITFVNPDGEYETVNLKTPYSTQNITVLIFTELWLYDKKDKIVSKKIIEIKPMAEYYEQNDYENQNPLYKSTFVIKYAQFKEYLKKQNTYKISPQKDISFYEFLELGKYKFRLMETKDISTDQAQKILNQLTETKL